MVEALFFQITPERLSELRSLQDVDDDDLIDTFRVPTEATLRHAFALLTGEDRAMDSEPCPAESWAGIRILAVGRAGERALKTLPEAVLNSVGIRWAEFQDWMPDPPNLMDTSGTIVTLASRYRAVADPKKRLFVWMGSDGQAT